MFKVWLKQPESMQSKIATRRGQLAHRLHGLSLRQIACKDLRQIICKTTAKRNGILNAEQAATLADVPNVRQQGTRLGNWLTRDQAKALLAVPDRSTLKGKRDAVILALLLGCALRAANWRNSR
jgi:integrase